MNRPRFRAHSVTCVGRLTVTLLGMVENLAIECGYASDPVNEAMVVVPVDPCSGGLLEVGEPVERSGAKW